MDYMGLDPQIAQQILADELGIHKAARFRLTTRLKIFNRVGADEQIRKALQSELEMLEQIIGAYEAELVTT